MNSSKLLLGVLSGLKAITGISLVPEKGSKTNEQVIDKGISTPDDAKWKAEELYENILPDTKV